MLKIVEFQRRVLVMNSKSFPLGVRSRTFGSDTSFLSALRNHPRFQNAIDPDTGISATDCDVIVCNYKHERQRLLQCVQIIEVKSRNAVPSRSQEEVYRIFDLFKGKRGRILNYGVSFCSYDGQTFEASKTFRWGRFKSGAIFWRQVDRETMFDLVTMLKHPDTLTTRKLFQSHHGSSVIEMVAPMPLGFSTPITIVKRY